MRLGELPLASMSNRYLMLLKSKKNASLRLLAKKVYGPDVTISASVRRDVGIGDDLRFYCLSKCASASFADETLTVCLPLFGFEKNTNAISVKYSPSVSMLTR